MSFLNLFISAGKAFSAWRRRERAYAELMALDDRSLADIGVRRSQIRASWCEREGRGPLGASLPLRSRRRPSAGERRPDGL